MGAYTMTMGFAFRLCLPACSGLLAGCSVMQVNTVKAFFLYYRGDAEYVEAWSCLQTLQRLMQLVALGTRKALQR